MKHFQLNTLKGRQKKKIKNENDIMSKSFFLIEQLKASNKLQ